MKLLLAGITLSLSLVSGVSQASERAGPAALLEQSRWASDPEPQSFAALSGLEPMQRSMTPIDLSWTEAPQRSWAQPRPEMPDPVQRDLAPYGFGPGSQWNQKHWGGFGDDDFEDFSAEDGWHHHHHHHVAAVPEPSNWLLLACGVLLVGVARARRERRA